MLTKKRHNISNDQCFRSYDIFNNNVRLQKNVNNYNVLQNILKGWSIETSDRGWITAESFYEYITNVFYSWLKTNIIFPVILFMDGHSSHLILPLSNFCRQHEIELIVLRIQVFEFSAFLYSSVQTNTFMRDCTVLDSSAARKTSTLIVINRYPFK